MSDASERTSQWSSTYVCIPRHCGTKLGCFETSNELRSNWALKPASKWVSERASEPMTEWPSTYILILGCSEPLCARLYWRQRIPLHQIWIFFVHNPSLSFGSPKNMSKPYYSFLFFARIIQGKYWKNISWCFSKIYFIRIDYCVNQPESRGHNDDERSQKCHMRLSLQLYLLLLLLFLLCADRAAAKAWFKRLTKVATPSSLERWPPTPATTGTSSSPLRPTGQCSAAKRNNSVSDSLRTWYQDASYCKPS